MRRLSAGAITNQAANNQQINYSSFWTGKKLTLLNPTTDNFSKALLKSFTAAQSRKL
jgi:hypothetical protein